MLAIRQRAISAVDERLDFVNKKRDVLAAALGRVFFLSRRGVGNANNNHRRDFFRTNERLGGLAQLPSHTSKSRGRIKKILPVVGVDDRKTASWLFFIIRRQPYDQIALVAENR